MSNEERITYVNENEAMVIITKSEPYILLSTTGFGSANNHVESEKVHGLDGEFETDDTLDPRELSITFLAYGQTPEEDNELQRNLLDVFNPKLKGTLTYEAFGKSYEIDVRVTKGWTGEFDERTHIYQGTITFLAPYPLWRDVSSDSYTVLLGQVTNLLSFPLAIVDNYKFATVDSGKEVAVENPGHMVVGLELSIHCVAEVVNPRLFNPYTEEYFAFNYTFKGGDEIYVNTTRGEKQVLINGENGFFRRKLGSTFLQISNLETNYFILQADSGVENMIATMKYYPLLTGVC